MPSSLFLKRLLDLSDAEYSLFSKTIKDAQWHSFKELIALFPEGDAELATIRNKINHYINTST